MNASVVPKVSIGMPVYNGEPFIRQALDSLLCQTFSDFELIISDNASTDGTSSICEEYAARDKRIRYFRHDKNNGPIYNFNFVLEQAGSEYFMWAAADDTWDNQWIEVLLANFREDVIISFGHVCNIDEFGNVVRTYKPLYFGKHRTARLLRLYVADETHGKANLIYGIYRRSSLDQHRFIDQSGISEASDLFFVFQMAKMGEIAIDTNVRIYKRLSGVSNNPVKNEDLCSFTKFQNVLRRFHYSLRYAKLADQRWMMVTMFALLPVKIINAIVQHFKRDVKISLGN